MTYLGPRVWITVKEPHINLAHIILFVNYCRLKMMIAQDHMLIQLDLL